MVKIFFLCIFVFFQLLAELDLKTELTLLKSIGKKSFNKDEKADLIIVDFWASWCGPCKESFPFYEKEIESQKSKNILFISVNLDDKIEKAKNFLKEFPHSGIAVWDEKKSFMNQLGFNSIPYMLILDKDWKVLDKIKGFNSRTKRKFKDSIK